MKCPICKSKLKRNFYGDWLCLNYFKIKAQDNESYGIWDRQLNHYFRSKIFNQESIIISTQYLLLLEDLKLDQYSAYCLTDSGFRFSDIICKFPRDIFKTHSIEQIVEKLNMLVVFK